MSRRQASGLPCGVNRNTLMHVRRDRLIRAVETESLQTGEDFFTVLERCDGCMFHWLLCSVAGLSARVVGGMRVCCNRRSPGVGVNRRRRCGTVCLQAKTKPQCFAAEEIKYEIGPVGDAGFMKETLSYMGLFAQKCLQNSVMSLMRGHPSENIFRRMLFNTCRNHSPSGGGDCRISQLNFYSVE